MSILKITNLDKSFKNKKVIDKLSFELEAGYIYGFLGQNGAGKTTTMKMILGILKPTNGEIFVCNEKVNYGETKTNRYIGYLQDVPEFYNFYTPMEYLLFCGEISGMNKNATKKKATELLKLVGLLEENRKIGKFSRGMKQRLGIAAALLNSPQLLICDEPTTALDPIGRKQILDILQTVKKETTIIFSTHILSDVERICDYAMILHDGKLVKKGTLEELKRTTREDAIVIDFENFKELKEFEKILKSNTNIDYEILDFKLSIKTTRLMDTKKFIYNNFSNIGIYPNRVEILETSLEKLYLEVMKQ